MSAKAHRCKECQTWIIPSVQPTCPTCGTPAPKPSRLPSLSFAGSTTLGCALPLLALGIPTAYHQITGHYTRHPYYIALTAGMLTVALLLLYNLYRTIQAHRQP